ncbi:MAG: hypothetical protein JEY96_00655 [Bacteroidales bacterium]|nr:hypothetical protein [Bacteroidales bacterium]
MKTNQSKIFISTFFLLLGKVIFDLNLYADFFEIHNSMQEIALAFGYASMSGLITILIFNYLQRSFRFGIATLYTYLVILGLLVYSYLSFLNIGIPVNLFYIVGISISSNLLLILTIRGLLVRIGNGEIKKLEKASNVASNLGILSASFLLIIFLHYYKIGISNFQNIHYLAIGSILLSAIFMFVVFRKNKNANDILDSIQEIKVKQNIFKLLTRKYFTTILVITALAAFAMVIVYSLFVEINISRNHTSFQLLNLFSITAVIFSITSALYELFFKEKAYYSFGVKIHLIIMPIVVLVFCVMLSINTFYLKITEGNEFYFFIPIAASLFVVFSHFSFVNLFYPVINSLYLPLETKNQNDFYIKSTFLGFLLGIGASSLVGKYFITRFNFNNESGYIIMIAIVAAILLLINRFIVYNNYKTALHKRLDIEEKTEITKKSFVYNTMQKIKEFSGIKIVRIVNLLYLINPVESKKFFGQLTSSEDVFTQRAGLINAIKLYLLEIHEEMLKISKTKHFPSSPNRDKIEQLLFKFEELKTKMQKTYYIPQLSISKKDIERVYGGILANYAPKEQQAEILARLVRDPKLPVAKNAIISSSGINNSETIKSVIEKLGIAELSNAAYSALLNIDNESIDILEDTFYQTGQSEKVQIKIVRLMGDIASEKAVEYLLKKLNYTNQNIISAALEALSKCNIQLPEKKAMIIKHELEEVCKYIVWNTALFIDLDKYFASEILLDAIKVEIEYNYKSLFNLLALLYNPGSVELIRKNLWSNNYEKVSFALELASVIIKDEMKPMVLPLIRPMSNEERLKRMQTIFTTEKMQYEDILYDIIQRDYKWINPWTKACAIMEISTINKEDNLSILLANMVNPDPMLAELSALSVFSIEKDAYFKNKEIFDKEYTNIVSKTAIQAIENSKEKNKIGMPTLKFEIIKYLKGIEEFSIIPGEILKYLTDTVTPLQFEAGEEIENIDNLDISNYHYIIYAGKVNLFINDVFVKCFEKDTLLSTLDLLIDYDAIIKLVADTDVQIYKIDPSEFADNLSFYDEIPFSIIENTSQQKIAIYEDIMKNEREYIKTQVEYI